MMDMAATAASIAQGITAAFGGPFYPALLHRPAARVEDAGGSIVPGVAPPTLSCLAQVDAVTEAMRGAEGFTDRDMRILVMAATLAGEVTTDAELEVLQGPNAGRWQIASVARDPSGVQWELRGRRA